MNLNSEEITKYIELAKKSHKERNLDKANQIYKTLINNKIYRPDLLMAYGLFNMEINNLQIAKNLFNLSIKKYPLLIKPYILLAEIFRKEKNFNDSYKLLQKAKNIEKNNYDIDYNLSIHFKTINLYDDAIFYIDNAIKNKPKNDHYKILKEDIFSNQ